MVVPVSEPPDVPELDPADVVVAEFDPELDPVSAAVVVVPEFVSPDPAVVVAVPVSDPVVVAVSEFPGAAVVYKMICQCVIFRYLTLTLVILTERV